jgi:hypothetical protein
MEIKIIMTLRIKASEPAVPATASAFALTLTLAALLFSGPAAADGNPFVGEWEVTFLTSDGEPFPQAAELAAAGGVSLMRVTENTTQAVVSFQGQTSESPLTMVAFFQQSDTVWEMCTDEGSDCVKATLISPDSALFEPSVPDPSQPSLALTRRK